MSSRATTLNEDNISDKIITGSLLTKLEFGRWLILIDLALLLVAILMVLTSAKVFYFHIVFILLTLGAFFWKFRPFCHPGGLLGNNYHHSGGSRNPCS